MSHIKTISQYTSVSSISSSDILVGNQSNKTRKFPVSTLTNYLCSEYLQSNAFSYVDVDNVDTTSTGSCILTGLHTNGFLTIDNGTTDTFVKITSAFHETSRIGTQIILLQVGTGTVTVSSLTPTANIISSFERYKLIGQNSAAVLVKIANNTWFLGGDISV